MLKSGSPLQSFDPALLEKLTQPGVLGIFNHVEVTSVLATHRPSKRTANVFTHLVTVERTGLRSSPESLLPIKFSKLADWSFGITQHSVALATLTAKLQDALMNEQWVEQKGSLTFGKLLYQGHWFVPPAGCLPDAALNRLLKNNFWNGSHVWEWAAKDKSDFLPFFETPPLLHSLSQRIAEHLPIQLASLSDKLGSLVLQIPVTCLVSDYRGDGNPHGGVICDVMWNPGVPPRPLTVTAERWHDGQLSHSSTELEGTDSGFLPAEEGPGGVTAVIHDKENDVVLGAMQVNIISCIHNSIHIRHPDSRTFAIKSKGEGESRQESVEVTSSQELVTGDPKRLAHFGDTRKRIYRDEMRVLRERREFVQYRPDDVDENGLTLDREQRHLRALVDIRYLITHHGKKAAWLWDPFLDATDVLETLFHAPHGESEMRALSGAQQVYGRDKLSEGISVPVVCTPVGVVGSIPFARVLEIWRRFSNFVCNRSANEVTVCGAELGPIRTKKEQFIITQRELLTRSVSNLDGLLLEFRANVGASGFLFHDRFLIFPYAEPEPLAWSLGTSINSAGKEHHILQKVPNGRLIADAFQALWDDLNQPEQLVWKAP